MAETFDDEFFRGFLSTNLCYSILINLLGKEGARHKYLLIKPVVYITFKDLDKMNAVVDRFKITDKVREITKKENNKLKTYQLLVQRRECIERILLFLEENPSFKKNNEKAIVFKEAFYILGSYPSSFKFYDKEAESAVEKALDYRARLKNNTQGRAFNKGQWVKRIRKHFMEGG